MYRIVLFALLYSAAITFGATPGEIAARQALDKTEKQPDHAPQYSALAMAYARRARETSDTAFYAKAEEAVQESLKRAPANFDARKAETWLLLGRHEFAKARETAQALNRQAPDDLSVYGYLVDANVELGNYKEAVEAAQWMLDLRPGNTPGLVRAGYLRELHGDLSGALELMQMAYESTAPSETEDRAWLLTQISHLHFVAGDLEKAERYAQDALAAFPDYHYALAALAKVRVGQGRYSEAVNLYRKRLEVAPHAENLFVLAEALKLAGETEEARKAFERFERESRRESSAADNSDHELIFYYVDYAGEPRKALEVAQRELGRRQDVFTRDAYAWALAANGDYRAASVQIGKVLAVGVRDPKILLHAREIAGAIDGRQGGHVPKAQ